MATSSPFTPHRLCPLQNCCDSVTHNYQKQRPIIIFPSDCANTNFKTQEVLVLLPNNIFQEGNRQTEVKIWVTDATLLTSLVSVLIHFKTQYDCVLLPQPSQWSNCHEDQQPVRHSGPLSKQAANFVLLFQYFFKKAFLDPNRSIYLLWLLSTHAINVQHWNTELTSCSKLNAFSVKLNIYFSTLFFFNKKTSFKSLSLIMKATSSCLFCQNWWVASTKLQEASTV